MFWLKEYEDEENKTTKYECIKYKTYKLEDKIHLISQAIDKFYKNGGKVTIKRVSNFLGEKNKELIKDLLNIYNKYSITEEKL